MTKEITSAKRNKVERQSYLKETIRRYKKSKLAMIGLLIFVIIVLFAAFAGLFGTYEDSITQNIMHKLQTPNAEHWFGTDRYGRDLFLRCIYGARISLVIGLTAMFLAMIVGVMLGMTAGFYGGLYDNLVMRGLDIFSAIPTILLAICVVAALGSSTPNLVIALAISRMPAFARIARASVLGISGQEYVEAARAGGTKDLRILLRHVLPNMLSPLIVQATACVASLILQTASLSFLGLGVPAPTPEWGAIITEGKSFVRTHPYTVWIPGMCVIAASLSVSLIGDGLRDALDPRLKS